MTLVWIAAGLFVVLVLVAAVALISLLWPDSWLGRLTQDKRHL